DQARQTVAELSSGDRSLLAAQVDVTDEESVQSLASELTERFGRVDVLINNAGVALDKFQPFEATSTSVFEETLQVNTLGAFRVTKALLPMLRVSEAPRIVNVSSQLGSLERMTSRTVAYRASKAALNAVTRSVAHELADTPAKVNSVCPGWVATELGGLDAPTSPSEGARGIVWAATLPEQGPTGGFFQEGTPLPW
ncbi:MAG TPA: short-chain dehydrogenase, partial [Deltaproteobacteria bacterium]|nr:short-chain dehydrogenase [Deltaproteobacteria bacterium]